VACLKARERPRTQPGGAWGRRFRCNVGLRPTRALANVVAVGPDLLFASRIEATLSAVGHEVELESSVSNLSVPLEGVDLLVVDVDREDAEAAANFGVPVLGFYSHVNVGARERAETAGVDLVVPRSRLAREMVELVERLSGGGR
jgi:hypothetical protein